MVIDPAASLISVMDDIGDKVDDIRNELTMELGHTPDRPEEGMQSIAYLTKRIMSQLHIVVEDITVRSNE